MTITWCVVDFETASATNLKKAGAWVYAECPTTEILCLNFQHMTDPVRTWLPSHGKDTELWDLAHKDSVMFVAFNVQFEKAIWRNIMIPLGWPDIPDERWHDVQAVCAMKNIPLDLDRATLVLRLSEHKDKEGSKFTIGLSKPNKKGEYDRSPEAIRRAIVYGIQDIVTETSAHRRLGWLPPGERKVWLLNQKINQRGLRIDLAFVRKAQEIVDKASEPLLAEFAEITGGLKPGQRDKFLAWMDGQGVKLPNLQKEYMTELLGEDVDDTGTDGMGTEDFGSDSVGIYPNLPDLVRRALTIRQLVNSTSIKKLSRMVECTCADGRAKGLLQYHGTGPGRSAGRLFQPHNFPRGTIKTTPAEMVEAIMTGDPNYLELTVGPAIECIVSALRHALVPDPDRIFLAGDYAGIQARTVLAVAGQHDKTALMADGADIYCDMAQQIYKVPVDKKKDPEKRQVGKNSVLGLGFCMGAKKFQFKYGRYKEDGHTLCHPIEFCETVVHAYRKEWAPKVPYVWYGLQDAATKAVWSQKPQEAYGVEYRLENGWLSARLPSGRKIWYFNPKPIKKAMPWDKDDIREAFQFNAMKMGQWKTIDAFGGQLCENVVMGIERDLMTCAMLKCEENGMPVVLEVHDEIVVEPLKTDADEKAFEQIMLDVPDWCRQIQIPVAVETWQGDRYKK